MTALLNFGVSPHTSAFAMKPPPASIGDLPVVCYTLLDARHRTTGRTRHLVGGVEAQRPAGLAVCGDGEAYYLFGCDAGWEPVTDTWHETLDDALAQAEFEHAGTSGTWVRVGAG